MKRYGWISISLLIPLAVFSVAVVISSSIRIRLALVLAGFIYMIIIMALFTRYFYAPRRRLLEALKNGHSLEQG